MNATKAKECRQAANYLKMRPSTYRRLKRLSKGRHVVDCVDGARIQSASWALGRTTRLGKGQFRLWLNQQRKRRSGHPPVAETACAAPTATVG